MSDYARDWPGYHMTEEEVDREVRRRRIDDARRLIPSAPSLNDWACYRWDASGGTEFRHRAVSP